LAFRIFQILQAPLTLPRKPGTRTELAGQSDDWLGLEQRFAIRRFWSSAAAADTGLKSVSMTYMPDAVPRDFVRAEHRKEKPPGANP
jgi:hypothetical protein